MKYISAALLLLVIATAPKITQAGQLFPPDNLKSTPNMACPNGQVLRWMGDRVECVDPTNGVSLKCPKGEVLTGISFGRPDCTPLTVTSCATTPTGSTTKTSVSVSSSSSASATSSASGNGTSSASATASADASAKLRNTVRSW